MSDAREIIAKTIKERPASPAVAVTNWIVYQLEAAGYRILGPDEVDSVTLEKAAVCARECFDDPRADADPEYVPSAIRGLGRKA